MIAEAMDHALAAADYERAADLIQRYYKETIWFGEMALTRKWLEALPKALVRSRPFLCLLCGALSLDHSVEQAEGWLRAAAEAWQAQDPPLDGSAYPVFVANVLDIRTNIADVQGASSEEVIALTLQALESTPESVPALRAAMFQRLGWCYLNLGDEGAADRFFLQSQKLGKVTGHHGNAIGATCGRAIIAWLHGRLHEAVAICRETLQFIVEPLERSGRRLPAAGNLYIILGRILLELYELGKAELMLVKGVELAELTIRSGNLLDGYYALAILRCIERDFEGAYAWMDKAERTCTWNRESVRALWARIWLWRARVEMDHHYLDLALAWAHGRDVENPAEGDWELQSLAQAIIAGHCAYGEPDLTPLHRALDAKLQLDKAADRDDQIIQLLALEALARQAEGQMHQAMVLLERALPLAAPHHYVMTFVQHGAPMAALLREAVARDIAVAYAGKLLAALAGETVALPRPLAHRPPQQSLLEPLSQRELEVLRLLSSSLTGPQIADELFISVGTFRSHTKSIYSKLAVHNRIEAVERARELELV